MRRQHGGHLDTCDGSKWGTVRQASDSRDLGSLMRTRETESCARRSETKDADDAESRMARASTAEPSGAFTSTRQIISKAFDVKPAAACEVTDLVARLVGAGTEGIEVA